MNWEEQFEQAIDEYSRYRVGVTSHEFLPGDRKVKSMLYLVAYDISSPKRLAKTAKVCLDYGVRVEYSVFECDLEEALFTEMWERLADIMNEEEDSLLAYRLCGSCVSKIESAGIVKRPGRILLYMP
jgi:CRISPR-associated protein Cas2